MQEYIGFVGLGRMGAIMANHLLESLPLEMNLHVHDIRPERAQDFVTRAARRAVDFYQANAVATELGQVGTPGGIVFSMVSDSEALVRIALGQDGLLQQLQPGGILVSFSRVSPEIATDIARDFDKAGCTFLTAPVIGRPADAVWAALTILLAGDPTGSARVMPYLRLMCHQVHNIGEQVETAIQVALCLELVQGLLLEGMGEAVALLDRIGFARRTFSSLLTESFSTSHTLERLTRHMISQDDTNVQLPIFNVQLLFELARQKKVQIPGAKVLFEHLFIASLHDHLQDDWTVLTEYIQSSPTAYFDPRRDEH